MDLSGRRHPPKGTHTPGPRQIFRILTDAERWSVNTIGVVKIK